MRTEVEVIHTGGWNIFFLSVVILILCVSSLYKSATKAYESVQENEHVCFPCSDLYMLMSCFSQEIKDTASAYSLVVSEYTPCEKI